MAKIKECSKCSAADLVSVKGQPGATVRGIALGKTLFSIVQPTTYICRECGYIEEYVEGKDLAKVKKHKK